MPELTTWLGRRIITESMCNRANGMSRFLDIAVAACGEKFGGRQHHAFRHWMLDSQSRALCIHLARNWKRPGSDELLKVAPRLQFCLDSEGPAAVYPPAPHETIRRWTIYTPFDPEGFFALPYRKVETLMSEQMRKTNPDEPPEYMPLYDAEPLNRALWDVMEAALRFCAKDIALDLAAARLLVSAFLADGCRTVWTETTKALPEVDATGRVECILTGRSLRKDLVLRRKGQDFFRQWIGEENPLHHNAGRGRSSSTGKLHWQEGEVVYGHTWHIPITTPGPTRVVSLETPDHT